MDYFLNTLAWWQWLILASVPLAIVLLYFLKLKRQPLEVPSTYLWHRTIEDLHVNTIWQRLRQSLLLFLQLLLILLVILACLRPGWEGANLTGDRFIFLVDTSASMSATDEKPTRLEVAKKRIGELIDQMKSHDVAMILSFSDTAQVEQSFTDSRNVLRRKLAGIQPTNRTSDLTEALRAAAGLANPGRTSQAEDTNDIPAADPLPATLYIFSDGGFSAVPDFSLGNLEPVYVSIGVEQPENIGIVAFTTERNPERPDQTQAFARIENYGSADATVEAALYLHGELRDADSVNVPQGGSAGVQFALPDVELGSIEDGALKLEIKHTDDLPLDNVAYAAMNAPRRARVLVVTPRNDALSLALRTDEMAKLAEVSFVEPAILETQAYADEAAAAAYDLVVYDQCVPKQMPQANTLLIGNVPPIPAWTGGDKQGPPIIIDTDRVHPLMQLIEMGNVKIVESIPVKGPAGSTVLIDSDIGSLFSIGPREGFEDAVLGFEIFGRDQQGQTVVNTDWHIRRSFPVFVMNVVKYLGGTRTGAATASVQPGQPIMLRTTLPVRSVEVQSPGGLRTHVSSDSPNTFVFSRTDELGLYGVREGNAGKVSQQFAVNLFDSRESDLTPRDKLEIGHEEVQRKSGWEPARKELWKWLLLFGLVVLIFEWYVYNRRVYL